MRSTFSTIITANYYPRALALYRSIERFDPQATLQVLVADGGIVRPHSPVPANLRLLDVEPLLDFSLTRLLFEKYAHTVMDEFRWSMKPVFISWLLNQGFDKVLYLDCDMFFVNDYRFLWDELDGAGLLLAPSWNNLDPDAGKDSFLSSYTGGIFSAGFIGATKAGIPVLEWWARACHFMMGALIAEGVSNDQRYLDQVPVYFPGVKLLKHRGCNIGSWNELESKRTLVNGQTMILGTSPVIFVHFDAMLVQNILRGHDPLLRPFFDAYQECFSKEEYALSDFIGLVDTHTRPGLLRKLKWSLRLRSRVKKLLFRILQRI